MSVAQKGDKDRPPFIRAVLEELKGSFPGRHQKTVLQPPDLDFQGGYDEIYTGSQQGKELLTNRLRYFGLLTWIIWFGFGIQFWWFSDTSFLEFGVATALWILTFAFTIFGIPITRAMLRMRSK